MDSIYFFRNNLFLSALVGAGFTISKNTKKSEVTVKNKWANKVCTKTRIWQIVNDQ